MSEGSASSDPQIVEFSPYRAIGVSYLGKNEQREIPAMWENEFLPRMDEIETPPDAPFALGLCRCIPGVTDGSFEYIAALAATTEAPIPAGMVEAQIAAGSYVVFPVASLDGITEAWGSLGPWLETHTEWEGYCGPEGCDCATHPGFELYPPEFSTDGKLYVYLPVRRRA